MGTPCESNPRNCFPSKTEQGIRRKEPLEPLPGGHPRNPGTGFADATRRLLSRSRTRLVDLFVGRGEARPDTAAPDASPRSNAWRGCSQRCSRSRVVADLGHNRRRIAHLNALVCSSSLKVRGKFLCAAEANHWVNSLGAPRAFSKIRPRPIPARDRDKRDVERRRAWPAGVTEFHRHQIRPAAEPDGP